MRFPFLLILAANLAAQNPQTWRDIKDGLQSSDSGAFFKSNLKGVLLPVFTGTVVSLHLPQFVLALSDKTHPEVTLELPNEPKNAQIAPGAKISFRGVVQSFTKNPLMLQIEATGAVIVELDASAPMPVLSINYPSRLVDRFANISLDGLLAHAFTAGDTQLTGVPLDWFLAVAGWKDGRAHTVEAGGIQVDVPARRSFGKQAWLVPLNGEVALVVVSLEGTVLQRVENLKTMRVLAR